MFELHSRVQNNVQILLLQMEGIHISIMLKLSSSISAETEDMYRIKGDGSSM
jgi:hypothetical protein